MKIRILYRNLDFIIQGVCYCGCGGETKTGNKYIFGHHLFGNSHTKGHHLSEEHKKKIKEKCGGWKHTEESKKKISKIKRLQNIHVSTEFKSGKEHPLWKGGITSLYTKIRNSEKYYRWRLEVFERDMWKCVGCGKQKCYFEAHHIKSFSSIIENNNIKTLREAYSCPELWDLNNGITLCDECHMKTKNYGKRDYICI